MFIDVNNFVHNRWIICVYCVDNFSPIKNKKNYEKALDNKTLKVYTYIVLKEKDKKEKERKNNEN